jgi:ribosomal protein S17E
MKKILSNKEIISILIEKTGVENQNQLAAYLTNKYGRQVDRRQIDQFARSESLNLTNMLLREAMDD